MRFVLLVILALSGTVACEDNPTAPAPPTLADPAALSTELAAANEPLRTSIFESFDALDHLTGPLASTHTHLIELLSELSASGESPLSVSTARLHSIVPRLSIQNVQDSLIQDTLLGTWVWDQETDSYVKSVTRPAPAQTVRILLYLMDGGFPVSMPIEPVDEIGYLDIVDTQPATEGYGLRVSVRDSVGATTYLQYELTVAPRQDSFTATAVGFIGNGIEGTGERRLDFQITWVAHGTETLGSASADATFDLNDPAISLEVHDESSHSGTTITLLRDFRIRRPGELITLVGPVTLEQSGPYSQNGTLDLTVRVNGGLYAEIDGHFLIAGDVVVHDITFSGPGPVEIDVIVTIRLAADLFDTVADLFDPVARLSP